MSAGNFQFERKRNYELQSIRVDSNHTIKTGRTSTATDMGVIENPVCVYNPSANIALTLPDGSYIGQTVLVVVEANTSDVDAVLTVSSSANASEDVITLEDAGEYVELLWNGTDWDVIAYEGCSLA